MILRRVIEHVKAQNWTAVVLDFVIVVAGVFIGIQVSNWNAARAERGREAALVRTVRDDVQKDIVELKSFERTFGDIQAFGRQALVTLTENATCADECWPRIVAVFHASQWIDMKANRETFDEIASAGMPRDPVLKEALSQYYARSEQSPKILADFPHYRELVRSIIPAAVQDHMWAECFRVVGRQQDLIADCPAPISEAEVAVIIAELRADKVTARALNYWLSTVSVVKTTMPEQIEEAEAVVAKLDAYLDSRP